MGFVGEVSLVQFLNALLAKELTSTHNKTYIRKPIKFKSAAGLLLGARSTEPSLYEEKWNREIEECSMKKWNWTSHSSFHSFRFSLWVEVPVKLGWDEVCLPSFPSFRDHDVERARIQVLSCISRSTSIWLYYTVSHGNSKMKKLYTISQNALIV